MTSGQAQVSTVAGGGGATATLRAWLRYPASGRRPLLTTIRFAALLALLAVALATPGFTSKPSLLSMLTSMSFIGCVAVGMTFITISGNIMSFCLGATLSATSMVFAAALPWGLLTALLLALAVGGGATVAQGIVIGYVRANPIIVSIAALTLITGVANVATAGRRVYAAGTGADALKGKIAGVPVEVVVFLAVVVLAQLVLTHTRFGRNVYMVGSNLRAAEAAGVRPWRTVSGAYLLAGLFAAISGILVGARYGLGDMELGLGYDYDAIAGVLVGGTAIHGGEGSVVRTLVGVTVIAVVQALLLLHGFSKEMQYLMTGLIVLGVIMLHTMGRRE